MLDARQILDSLKIIIRSQNMTYQDIATELSLSESTVKRMFSDKNINLNRLDKICRMLDMDISELVKFSSTRSNAVFRLSETQEQDIVSDLLYLLVTVLVINRWSVGDILNHYSISKTELKKYLVKLESIRVIKCLEDDQLRLLIPENYQWIENGPIEQFFRQTVLPSIIETSYQAENQQIFFRMSMLSKRSREKTEIKIKNLIQELRALDAEDEKLPIDDRHGMNLVVLFSPWQMPFFEQFRK